ncbi:MAG: hypothetical protein H7Y11_06605 [Armatimonadetes bacterium]|nr:hypothetical protein [Anaerolineae bacterium]
MTDILIISNNVSSRISYCAALTGYGYSVAEAQNVDDALRQLTKNAQPRAIIVDLKFSGALTDAYRQFDALYGNRARPTLIIIGGSDNAHLTDGMADVFLARPVELQDLIEHVQASLN